MFNKTAILGFDPGFGNIKLYTEAGGTVYASHASQVAGKNYGNLIDDTAKSADLVEFGNARYYTGKLAPLQGVALGNLGPERLLGGNESGRSFMAP